MSYNSIRKIKSAVSINQLSREVDILSEIKKKSRGKRSRKKRQVKDFGNCKYCGCKITENNHYVHTICDNRECVGKLLEFCQEDCLNCKYPDCILYMGIVKRKKYFSDKGIPYTFSSNMRDKI